MIAFLRGKTIGASEEGVILDVNGVGYDVLCTPQLLEMATRNKEIGVWIYTSVKEDAIQLYGFRNESEKSVFTELLKVDRVGPKMALKILSGSSYEKVVAAIDAGDAAELSKLPKVGKKMAEQIIFKLKGKLPGMDFDESPNHLERKQVLSALVNLGYKSADVEKVLEKLPKELTVEEGVRKGLAALTGQSI